MRVRNVAFCTAAVALAIAGLGPARTDAQVVAKVEFPRIGGYLINNNSYAEPSHRADVAKLDLAVLGMWGGWERNGVTMASAVADIRSRADAAGNDGLLLAKYTIMMESSADRANQVQADIWQKMSRERGPGAAATDWWARDSAGRNVGSWPDTWNLNITRFTSPDANGDRVPQWKARRDFDTFFRGIPEFDIWFLDNWFWRPRTTADWNGDGVNDSRNNAAVQRWYRLGTVDWLEEAETLAPGLLIMGNVDGDIGGGNGMLTEPEFRGTIGAALFEGAMGESYSIEANSTWERMMEFYRNLMANTRAPHLVLVQITGPRDDYQMFRYAFGSVLMDDGYLSYNHTGGGADHWAVTWFDEYDLAGSAGTDWLGRAVSAPPTGPWSRGVYRRDFENGVVLVNPKGNGRRTVTVEPGLQRIAGVQDRSVNNGQPADSITLRERDGILLIREQSVSAGDNTADRPGPPVILGVQ